MAIKNSKIIIPLILLVFCVQFCFAKQGPDRADFLRHEIKASKAATNLEPLFEELMDIYAKDNNLNEFYNFLGTLDKNKVFKTSPVTYYFKASVRFKQIKFLQDNKMWQELFDNKNSYIADLAQSLAEAKKLSTSLDSLALRIKLLEWQVNKDDEKASLGALEDLFSFAQAYKDTESDIQVIKDIADELSKDKETNYAKKLYSVYVSKVSKMNIKPEALKSLADKFLEESKVDLAATLYSAYLDKIQTLKQDQNTAIKQMFDVAGKFAHSGWGSGPDPFFAEKVYNKIESLYSIGAFDEISLYRRAYNLERAKEYDPCFAEYLRLVNNFPNYKDKDRIYFRLGILSAYIFNKTGQAKEYFLKVVADFPQSQDYLNSLYHLGLLEHWQGNLEKAKGFYNIILENTKEAQPKPEIVNSAESRIKEINENKEIEYNLRMFLGAVLNKEGKKPNLQLELFAKVGKGYLKENVRFEVSCYLTETGCLQQDFTYLWSGDLGSSQNPLNQDKFETNYQDLGTKAVNVVLIGPSGSAGGAVEMADIYPPSQKTTGVSP